jgi:hypothetical protein
VSISDLMFIMSSENIKKPDAENRIRPYLKSN